MPAGFPFGEFRVPHNRRSTLQHREQEMPASQVVGAKNHAKMLSGFPGRHVKNCTPLRCRAVNSDWR